MARIVHFELPSTNMAASRKFYESVFGWKFTRYEGQMEYWLVKTGEESEPGINGGLGGAVNEFKTTVNTVGVDNIDDALKKSEANGAQVIYPKGEIPGMGWLAYIREPGGAIVGLYQAMPGTM
jgi:predicted enzyme related to lactoylglutathione lyase